MLRKLLTNRFHVAVHLSSIREVKHDVYGKRQTAKMKLLTSLVQYVKILGQQQLFMVNFACGFNQSETGKHFE